MRLFLTELKKLRRRHIGLLYAGGLLVAFLWMLWAMDDMHDTIITQGYYYLLLSVPLLNAIFLPTIIAASESRLCDIEIKGDNFKMLCTLEPRLSIYHTKMLVGSLYLLFFSLAETAMIPILANIYKVRQPLPYYNLGVFFLSTFIVSFVLMLIQQPLSLMSSNQLFPIFFGIGGTFVGLFSWFFPNINLRYFLPWGYYCVGTTINMDYDEATRIVTYYTIPFPIKFFLCFLLFGIIVYLFGRRQFMKKEV